MNVDNLFDHDSEARDINHKTYVLASGNKVHAKRKDPYGFVFLNYDKGMAPAELTGAFTSFYEAERALNAYMAKKGRTFSEEK